MVLRSNITCFFLADFVLWEDYVVILNKPNTPLPMQDLKHQRMCFWEATKIMANVEKCPCAFYQKSYHCEGGEPRIFLGFVYFVSVYCFRPLSTNDLLQNIIIADLLINKHWYQSLKEMFFSEIFGQEKSYAPSRIRALNSDISTRLFQDKLRIFFHFQNNLVLTS